MDASPYPRLQRKLDFQRPSGKNSASTFALSKPDIGPQSSPSARAAMMKYPPWMLPFRKAVTRASSSFAANRERKSLCGNRRGSRS